MRFLLSERFWLCVFIGLIFILTIVQCSIAQAKPRGTSITNVEPVFVWILCDGVPVALVATTSHRFFAGDVKQLNYAMDAHIPPMLDEARANNTLAELDLSDRPWIECKIK